MNLLTSCPHCKAKTFSIIQKIQLLGDDIIECSNCGERNTVSSVIRLFFYIIVSSLLSSFVIIFWMVFGSFFYGLVISIVISQFIAAFIAYLCPLISNPKSDNGSQ